MFLLGWGGDSIGGGAAGLSLALRLAELDQVVAIKESSGDWNNYYATAMAVAVSFLGCVASYR